MSLLQLAPRHAVRPSRGTRFFFRACRAVLECGALIVTVPAADLRWRGGLPTDAPWDIDWCEAQPLDFPEIRVPCEPGSPQLHAVQPTAGLVIRESSCRLVFTGAVRYGRIPGDPRFSLEVRGVPLAHDPDGRIWRPYSAVEIVPLHQLYD